MAAVRNPFKAASRPVVGPPSRFPSLRGRCLPLPDVQCPRLFHVCSNFSCSSGRADLVLNAPSCLGREQKFPSFLLAEASVRAQPLSDSPCQICEQELGTSECTDGSSAKCRNLSCDHTHPFFRAEPCSHSSLGPVFWVLSKTLKACAVFFPACTVGAPCSLPVA